MSKNESKVALVTGANRGIGFEVCRQLAKKGISVLLTSRSEEEGKKAEKALRSEDLDVSFLRLDITKQSDVEAAFKHVETHFNRLDILINNAGVILDPSRHPPKKEDASIFSADLDIVRASMETNTYGAIRMIQTFVPLMKKRNFGRIVNISSGMGQLSDMNGGWTGYRLSKVALNAVTRIAADELAGTDILVNSVCPGWVKTRMGGPDAETSVEEAADTILWLTREEQKETGGFFRERERIEW